MTVGTVVAASAAQVDEAIGVAARAQPAWDAAGPEPRAAALERAADLFEQDTPELVAMCVREAGKSVPDSIAEVREAVDFLRYYAARAREDFGRPLRMPGPTGESNESAPRGTRGVRLREPVELPAGDLRGAGRRGARRGQHGDRKARGADATGRGTGRAAAAAGRHPGRGAAFPAGRRRGGRRACRGGCSRGRRGVHRFDRDGPADTPQPRGARGRDPGADRGNRRPERDDRGQLGAAGAGGRSTPRTPRSTARASAARRCASCACRRTSRRR